MTSLTIMANFRPSPTAIFSSARPMLCLHFVLTANRFYFYNVHNSGAYNPNLYFVFYIFTVNYTLVFLRYVCLIAVNQELHHFNSAFMEKT